jgi:hypothetical protein
MRGFENGFEVRKRVWGWVRFRERHVCGVSGDRRSAGPTLVRCHAAAHIVVILAQE